MADQRQIAQEVDSLFKVASLKADAYIATYDTTALVDRMKANGASDEVIAQLIDIVKTAMRGGYIHGYVECAQTTMRKEFGDQIESMMEKLRNAN